MITEILLAATFIMLASLSGAIFIWKSSGQFVQRNLRFLVTFALGVFVATLYLMLREILHFETSVVNVAIAASVGALSLELLQRLVPEGHHHHGADKDECCKEEHMHAINPKRVLLGDAAHNIGDGILLVPAFLVDFHVGVAVAFGVLLHEVVQEISEFFILKEAGYTTKQALLRNFLVSATILIGVLMALLIARSEEYVPLLIAFSIGAFLYIIVRDLLPHVIARIQHAGKTHIHLLAVVAGIAVMLMSANIVPHTHDLREDSHEHEQEATAHDHHRH